MADAKKDSANTSSSANAPAQSKATAPSDTTKTSATPASTTSTQTTDTQAKTTDTPVQSVETTSSPSVVSAQTTQSVPLQSGTDVSKASDTSSDAESEDAPSTRAATQTTTSSTTSTTSTPLKSTDKIPTPTLDQLRNDPNYTITIPQSYVETDQGCEWSREMYVLSGVTPITFSLGPDAPPSVSIDPSTGIVKGNYKDQYGTFTFTVNCVDAIGTKGTGKLTVIVNPPLKSVGEKVIDRSTGQDLGITIRGTGGSGYYEYSLIGAPSGIQIGKMNGVLSGSIASTGKVTFTVLIDDKINVWNHQVTVNVYQSNPDMTNRPANFTGPRSRPSDIGMAELRQAISLRNQTPPELTESARLLLSASRKLQSDPADEFLRAYAQMHIDYGTTWMAENVYFVGMFDTISYNDLQFMNYLYYAFRQVVYYGMTNGVDWNRFLRLVRNQKILNFLMNYNRR